jgi:hypothetical protein
VLAPLSTDNSDYDNGSCKLPNGWLFCGNCCMDMSLVDGVFRHQDVEGDQHDLNEIAPDGLPVGLF